MNLWRPKLRRILILVFGVAALFGLAAGVVTAPAQQVITLIHFTNVWKYDQSGRELGAAWRTNNYDDSTWATGRGLLGLEPDTPQIYTFHAPINTLLTISSTVTTFYFRTTFQFAGGAAGLSLVATNLVDDGCVIYLNGLRVGGVRAPAPAIYNATTFFPAGTEGALEPVAFTNLSALRVGVNLLAVEVHQAANPSADTMWGMKLMAIQTLPLVITNQPQSQAVIAGSSVTLTVGVSGGPAIYRWEKEGVIQASTSNALNISNAQLANAGNYRVIITNAISAVTSSVATLTVIADRDGPRLIAAIGNNAPPGASPFGSNTVNVMFDDFMNQTTVLNTNNYTLTRLGTTNTVRVLSIQYSPMLGVLLNIDSTDPDWAPGSDYVVTVNRVQDARGNVIAPDSQIAVAWPRNVDLLAGDAAWSFHTSAIFDSAIYDENWTSTHYIEGPWWGQGRGIFCGGPAAPLTCFGATTQTEIGFQPEPSLFRTAFLWPAELGSTAQLRISMAADDGLILYLNGQVIARSNVPASVTDVSPISRATASIINAACATNIVVTITNLLPGTNGLAAAVLQSASGDGSDTIFGLRLTGTVYPAPALPDAPLPILNLNLLNTNSVRLSWSGGGYALESSTNLDLGSASYPLGPWQQVTNMSNPYTNSLSDPARFFRLKK